QNLYKWLQALVQQNEITEYTEALNNFKSFQSDPCHYTLDPDLAQQYGISFDGTLWCFPGLSRGFSPPIPAADYFIAYGMKQSYQKPAGTYREFAGRVAGLEISMREALGGLAPATIIIAAYSWVPFVGVVVFQAVLWAALYGTALTTATFLEVPAIVSVVGFITNPLIALYAGPAAI